MVDFIFINCPFYVTVFPPPWRVIHYSKVFRLRFSVANLNVSVKQKVYILLSLKIFFCFIKKNTIFGRSRNKGKK